MRFRQFEKDLNQEIIRNFLRQLQKPCKNMNKTVNAFLKQKSDWKNQVGLFCMRFSIKNYLRAFRTIGITLSPYSSMDFIMSLCEGPPTSICATNRVSPKYSIIAIIFSATSFTFPINKAPSGDIPPSNCIFV